MKQNKHLKFIFRNNYFFLNSCLFTLCIVAVIIIAIDIGSELAAQKNEIGNVIEIFEDCCNDVILPCDASTKVERKLLFEISQENLFPEKTICNFSVNDRGPPGFN